MVWRGGIRGSAHIAENITRALGRGSVATIVAAFVQDLLGPGWLAAAIVVVSAWIALRRDEASPARDS
jgi:hypothetical protein